MRASVRAAARERAVRGAPLEGVDVAYQPRGGDALGALRPTRGARVGDEGGDASKEGERIGAADDDGAI